MNDEARKLLTGLEDIIIWEIIVRRLPVLKKEVQSLLNDKN